MGKRTGKNGRSRSVCSGRGEAQPRSKPSWAHVVVSSFQLTLASTAGSKCISRDVSGAVIESYVRKPLCLMNEFSRYFLSLTLCGTTSSSKIFLPLTLCATNSLSKNFLLLTRCTPRSARPRLPSCRAHALLV